MHWRRLHAALLYAGDGAMLFGDSWRQPGAATVFEPWTVRSECYDAYICWNLRLNRSSWSEMIRPICSEESDRLTVGADMDVRRLVVAESLLLPGYIISL